jgi:hypothetical protein
LSDPIIPAVWRFQFFQQLANASAITRAEALAAVERGAIPEALQPVLDAIADPGNQFAAKMYLAGTTSVARTHSVTEAIGTVLGMPTWQMDDLFAAAKEL